MASGYLIYIYLIGNKLLLVRPKPAGQKQSAQAISDPGALRDDGSPAPISTFAQHSRYRV